MINSLYENFFHKHQLNGNKFLYLQNNNTISYNNFINLVQKISFFFKEKGLNPGDRVSVKLKKSHFFLAIYGACVHRGLIFIPLNDTYKDEELLYFLNDSESKLLITNKETSKNLKNKKLDKKFLIDTIEKDGSGSILNKLLKDNINEVPVKRKLDDIVAILYTSGTTGKSKGAMISQENLISNAETLKNFWHFNSKDVLIHALPIYHTHGLFVATNTILASSAKMIFHEKFDIDQLIKSFPNATVLMGVPTFYSRLLESKKLKKVLLKKMRLFISGSAPLSKEINDNFLSITGSRILERYGMTETNMITSNPYKCERKSGTVGLPLPEISVRICDRSTGKLLRENEVGEIQVKGKNVFTGYWKMPEKNLEIFTSDGFFKTEDLGRFDKDGYFEIVGRLKDLIISGGLNIYPKEIENILNMIDGIEESAVIGVPHNDFGEAVIAVITNEKNTQLGYNDISKILEKKMAKYKCPKAYIFKKSLPRNNLGKILKNKLREEYHNYFN